MRRPDSCIFSVFIIIALTLPKQSLLCQSKVYFAKTKYPFLCRCFVTVCEANCGRRPRSLPYLYQYYLCENREKMDTFSVRIVCRYQYYIMVTAVLQVAVSSIHTMLSQLYNDTGGEVGSPPDIAKNFSCPSFRENPRLLPRSCRAASRLSM